MKKRHLKTIVPVLITALFLSACAELDPSSMAGNGNEEKEDEIVSLGLTPEFDYEVPKSIPDIMVNQVGYASDSSKVAVFRGETLPDTYDLVNAETGDIVYTGAIEPKGYNETTKENISYGDFTDYTVPGTYYLQADIIGQSYLFVIEHNPYEDIFTEALKQYYYNRCGLTLSTQLARGAAHNACHTKTAQLKEDTTVQIDVAGGWHIDGKGNRDVISGCQAVNNLLLAYELYGGIFTDEVGIPESGNGIPDVLDEVKYETDWLLKMQDSTSGAVYSAVSVIENPNAAYVLYVEPATVNATIQFAATMAKFSYLYQGYDRDFATQCLRAADRAYRYVEKYPENISKEEYFFAAAELYRATGTYGYHDAVLKYLKEESEPDIENDYVFWGCVTYLSTKQRVDVAICEKVITKLLAAVERISLNSKSSKYLTEGNLEQSNNNELLQKMARMAVVDHIITNHEYMMVLENHLHYFLGRNAQSVKYIDHTDNNEGKINIMKQMDLNAQFILFMSVIEEELAEK
ncbi:MAG: glycoside hydrolase family 9 protein [Bacillus sp. (in: Bacteria)]|nr:glycoside hydrolase family 9 protein [Bacillus sp. (in: firmicutes)]MCM1426182.1 glycoside hydrolase family 9 protein [Eubacterium sp.]